MSKSKLRVASILVAFSGLLLGFQNCSKIASNWFAISASPSIAGVVDVTPPSVTTAATPTPVAIDQSAFQPVLADRYYLDSVFNDVFGPTARATNTTASQVDAVNNGGPCSVYENYNSFNSKGAAFQRDPLASCTVASQNYAVASVNANATVSRQALLARACSDLTTNETTLSFALAKLSRSALPPVSDASLKSAFRLFYRTHPDPDPALLQALQGIFQNPASPTRDNWRDAIFTICASSLWQVI